MSLRELRTPDDSYRARNVRWTLADLGLATEEATLGGNKTAYVNQIRVPATALVILLHYNLARAVGTTITLSDIETHIFWRLLGVSDMSIVRYILSRAANGGIIDYQRAGDGPERITTRYDHRELLSTRLSLD